MAVNTITIKITIMQSGQQESYHHEQKQLLISLSYCGSKRGNWAMGQEAHLDIVLTKSTKH